MFTFASLSMVPSICLLNYVDNNHNDNNEDDDDDDANDNGDYHWEEWEHLIVVGWTRCAPPAPILH